MTYRELQQLHYISVTIVSLSCSHPRIWKDLQNYVLLSIFDLSAQTLTLFLKEWALYKSSLETATGGNTGTSIIQPVPFYDFIKDSALMFHKGR